MATYLYRDIIEDEIRPFEPADLGLVRKILVIEGFRNENGQDYLGRNGDYATIHTNNSQIQIAAPNELVEKIIRTTRAQYQQTDTEALVGQSPKKII